MTIGSRPDCAAPSMAVARATWVPAGRAVLRSPDLWRSRAGLAMAKRARQTRGNRVPSVRIPSSRPGPGRRADRPARRTSRPRAACLNCRTDQPGLAGASDRAQEAGGAAVMMSASTGFVVARTRPLRRPSPRSGQHADGEVPIVGPAPDPAGSADSLPTGAGHVATASSTVPIAVVRIA